jgi:hypothetical protein
MGTIIMKTTKELLFNMPMGRYGTLTTRRVNRLFPNTITRFGDYIVDGELGKLALASSRIEIGPADYEYTKGHYTYRDTRVAEIILEAHNHNHFKPVEIFYLNGDRSDLRFDNLVYANHAESEVHTWDHIPGSEWKLVVWGFGIYVSQWGQVKYLGELCKGRAIREALPNKKIGKILDMELVFGRQRHKVERLVVQAFYEGKKMVRINDNKSDNSIYNFREYNHNYDDEAQIIPSIL